MKRWGEAFYGDSAVTGETVVEQAQIAVVMTDRYSHLRYWNSHARELFGFAEGADPFGTSLLDIGIHESDRERAAQLARRVLKGETWEGTFGVVRADRTWMHVRVQAVPVCDDDGAIEGMAMFAYEAMRSGRVEEQYGLLERIGDRLAGSLRFDGALTAVAETLVPQFADHCFIDLYDGDRLVRRASVHAEGWSPPPGTWPDVGEDVHYADRSFAAVAMRRLEAVAVDDVTHPPGSLDAAAERVVEQVGVTSAVAAPLRARGELMGVLTLALSRLTPRDKATYDGFDRDLVGAVAGRVALAIDNARLFEEERSTALAFQNSLLPNGFPSFDGLSVAHRYLPAKPLEAHGRGVQTQVGGDFYDVIPLSAGRVGIVIGDVEGRGPHAAAVMGQLRAALRAFAQADREPADILRELDEWVRRLGMPDGAGGTWVPSVSCLYMVYDAWSRELAYANAAHLPPLLISGGHVDELRLEVTDSLLGVKTRGVPYDEAIYHQAELTLPPGATLLLFTDGLIDRRLPGGRADSRRALEQLRRRISGVAEADVERIAETALSAVPGENDDDTALLVVRTHPDELALREGWFVADAATVAEARHLAADTFSDWGMDPGQAELACLLVSEIVTNVVIHAAPHPVRRDFTEGGVVDSGAASADLGGEEFSEDWSDLLDEVADTEEDADDEPAPVSFLLRLRRGAGSVWVEVFDHDLRLPRIRSAGADDEGGRGLYLVDQLADRWGSRPTPSGKAVWFEISMKGE
ncbi:ATP-binding SpoIIE family protein phosphatase [Nocardiopsis coralliicola]